ncbi:hypothetical protein [Streptomyces silvisoli]|uniref:Uncharacterized protein n=1 Tax=Streptomyces silvisoli TaxID=3034235 RepID=A0ABT5ZIM2_9ACTN|nr:hypothetical protein [Streptomyces silvisoli]MDF3289666.1 hypothetical protein [Streptomyces silvisoli]
MSAPTSSRRGRAVPYRHLLRGGVPHMSDLLFIGLIIVAFALIGLAAKGVRRL